MGSRVRLYFVIEVMHQASIGSMPINSSNNNEIHIAEGIM